MGSYPHASHASDGLGDRVLSSRWRTGADVAVVLRQGERRVDALTGLTHGAGQSQAAEPVQAFGSMANQSCCPGPSVTWWHLEEPRIEWMSA